MIGLLIFLALPSFLFATNKNAGTSGAQFLKIGAGARPTAMGEAFVGVADDINSVYFNPAGVSYLSRPEMLAMHTQYFQGINYDFGAFAYPTDYGAFAVSAATLKVDDLQKRAANESLEGSFTALDAAYAFTYAANVNPTLSLGATARFLRQEIDTASAQTWTGDVGLVKRSVTLPLTFGFAVRHFGQPVKFRNESDPLPLTVDGGFGYSLWGEKLKLALDVKKVRDQNMQYGAGTEYTRNLGRDFRAAFRGGYNNSHTDTGDNAGISLGAGLGFRLFSFDFAWVPMGNLGNTFRYSAKMSF